MVLLLAFSAQTGLDSCFFSLDSSRLASPRRGQCRSQSSIQGSDGRALVCMCPRRPASGSITHSLALQLTHSRARSPLTRSLSSSVTHSLIHSLAHPLTHSLTRPLAHTALCMMMLSMVDRNHAPSPHSPREGLVMVSDRLLSVRHK